MESRRLLCPEKWLEGLLHEIKITGYHKLLKEILSHLICDALVLRSNIWGVCAQSSVQNVIPKPFEILSVDSLILIPSVILFDHVSHDLHCAIPTVALASHLLHHRRPVCLNHHYQETLYKNVKVLSDQLLANLLVQQILLLIYLFVVTSRFFGHDHPLDVFEALLHILSLLQGLALEHKNLLSLL